MAFFRENVRLHFHTFWCALCLSLLQLQALADPGLQKRGEQIFAEIFERPFLGLSRKKFHHFPKNISDDLFLVIDLFNVLVWYFFRSGAKSIADVNRGGAKSLLFNKFTVLSLRFLPPRGGKLHWQLRLGGHGRICPPDPPLATGIITFESVISPMRFCIHAGPGKG